jgi:hypothetical protein
VRCATFTTFLTPSERAVVGVLRDDHAPFRLSQRGEMSLL